MFTESEKMFKGTIHEDDYAVYHDALSLMTANEPIEYMKRKGYWDRLIRPLFNVTKHLGCYHNRVVGNHPYVMPLDAHLNQDLHTGHDWHCIITKHLNKDDERKFKKTDPKKMEEGYLKLWNQPDDEGIPSSKRIIEDIHLVVNVAWPAIYQSRGTAVHDLCQRVGRRRDEQQTIKKRGGKRTKNKGFGIIDYWMHKSVKGLIDERIQKSKDIMHCNSTESLIENNESDKEN